MTTLRSLRHAFVAALAFALFAIGATDAHATHFRYGTIRWESIPTNPTDPNAIRVKVTAESAWRRSFAWPSGQVPTIGVPLNTGYTVSVQAITSGSNLASAPLSVTPSSINGTEDWFVGASQMEFQFPRAQLPVRIFFENSARISTLQDGNNDRTFRVESIVSATPNAASPASSILPIITVGVGPAVRFFIPAADVENDTLTWSIAPLVRSQLAKAAPDGFPDAATTLSINSATGEVTWNTAAERPPAPNFELYAVQFIVRDSKGGETPVDALLRIVPTTGNPPQALINGVNSSASFSVRPNNPVSFTVTGSDVDAGATVTLNSGALPPGATMTPSLPTTASSPVNSVFQWTPTLAQAGNNFVVSFSATDNFGLQDTNSATITVLNNFPPVATCLAPVSVEATGPTGATRTLTTTVSDPDGDGLTVRWFVDTVLVQTDVVPASGGSTTLSMTRLYAIGSHPVRVEVNDGLALGQCTTSVTVIDGAPVLTLPPSQTLEATGPGGATATFTATATDAVDGPLPVTCVLPSGSTFPLGVNTVTCSATDSHGTTSTGTFTVTVVDTTAPTVTVPNTTAEATSPAGAAVTFVATASDIVDGNVTPVSCTPASGSTFPLGATTVTCTAVDSHGNTGTGTGTVTVVDTTGPTVTVPNTTAEATSAAGAIVTFVATASDLVDGNVTPVTCAPASGSTFPLGATTVTCTAVDSHGNSGTGTGTVTVVDTTGPTVTVPNTTAEATSAAGAIVTFVATAVDAVDGNLTPACTPASGSTFPLGATTVTCTATDSHGNVGTGTGTVTVVDTTPPVITVPANIVREATGPGGAVATYTATATDIVDGNVTPTCLPASGSLFAIFNPEAPITVRCNAVDAHGNAAIERTFTVTVRDTTPPVLHNVPANITVSPTGPTGAIVTWPAPNATDIVDLTVPVICVPPSGSLFPLGNTTVTCRATDAHGNQASASFVVRVADSTPPVVTVTLNPGALWPPDHKMVNVSVHVQTSDNDPNPSCVITGVTSNQPVNGTGDGDTDVDWAFTGLNLKLRRERAGNAGRDAVRIYTVTVSCTDNAGNVGTGTGTARVVHDQGNGTPFMGLNLK